MKTLSIVLLISLLAIPAPAAQIWFTSNVATHDLPEMFAQPQKWEKARQRINVFKFYGGQLDADTRSECPTCQENIFPRLKQVDAFDKLKEWGIELATEDSSVKPWDCDSTKNIDITSRLLRKMKQQNIHIRYSTLDEPLVSGNYWCKQPDEDTALYVSRYLKRLHEVHDDLYPDEIYDIGLIEAYPHHSADKIIQFINMVHRHGTKFSFLHLDIDHNAIRGDKISDSKVRSDMLKFKRFAQLQGIPLGVYFAGSARGTKPDHAKYQRDTMDLIKKSKIWFGTMPEHVQFQSWADTLDNAGNKEQIIPNNLPETWKLSHMAILLDGLKYLGL